MESWKMRVKTLGILIAFGLVVGVVAQSGATEGGCEASCNQECVEFVGTEKKGCKLSCFAGRCGNIGILSFVESSGEVGVDCSEDGVCNNFCADGAVDDPDCAMCGNGVVDPGERCDDGNATGFDYCSICTCDDPDGGTDLFVEAVTSNSGGGVKDGCVSTLGSADFGRPFERVCSDSGAIETLYLDCPSGYYCPTTHSLDRVPGEQCRPCRDSELDVANGCDDLNDNDCDGFTDEDDPDCY